MSGLTLDGLDWLKLRVPRSLAWPSLLWSPPRKTTHLPWCSFQSLDVAGGAVLGTPAPLTRGSERCFRKRHRVEASCVNVFSLSVEALKLSLCQDKPCSSCFWQHLLAEECQQHHSQNMDHRNENQAAGILADHLITSPSPNERLGDSHSASNPSGPASLCTFPAL